VVLNGAGAAGLACLKLMCEYGVKKENVKVCDTRGVVYKGRKEGMNKYKEAWANDTEDRTLTDACKNADCLIGLSAAGAFTQEMVSVMAANPIVFAMANPEPEILPELAR